MFAAVGEWLYQNVVGNLTASAIAGTAVWLWARRKFVHLHQRFDALHAHVTVRTEGDADGR